MGRVYEVYERIAGATGLVQAVSATSASVVTVTAPANAVACFITVEGTTARVVFDATLAPDSTLGLVLPASVLHFIPFAETFEFASTSGAASSTLNIQWLS